MEAELAIPRRRDRMVSDESWIREMLRYSLFCTVATVLDGQPFLRPSAFFYSEDDHAIYIHGAHSGRAFDNVKVEERVCLCVYAVGALRTHERAFGFFQEQAGVMVFGAAVPETDDAKKHAVIQALVEKHAPHLEKHVDYAPASQAEIDKTKIVRIEIAHWSGKLKWTEEPGRERCDYDDIIGDRRPRLPWSHDMSKSKPLTLEWARSRQE